MMQLLSLILLTLSTATILLTLISYILYKVRQLPMTQGRKADARKIDGVFFRRYLPAEALAAPQIESAPAMAPTQWWMRLPRTNGGLFAVVAVVIFTGLVTQRLLTGDNRSEFLSASERKELTALGLIKRYDLTSMSSARTMDEFVFPQQNARLGAVVAKLRDRRIVLVQSLKNHAVEDKRDINTAGNWTGFFATADIPYHISRDLSAVRPGVDVVVMPHPIHLSKNERGAITAALDKGISFIVTGPVGTAEGKPEKETAEWVEKTFGIRLLANLAASNVFPTIFASGTLPGWDIPPGLNSQWFPEDNRFLARAVSGTTALYEGDYRGTLHGVEGNSKATELTRAQFVTAAKGRAVWLAVDPHRTDAELTEAERFFARSAIVHSLAWASGVPTAKVANWKGGRKAAMALFLDTEDKFENGKAVADLLKENELPGTFFVVSNLFWKHPDLTKHLTSRMEVGSHSENHKPFSQQQLQEQFDRMQTSRYEIERLTKKPVLGFRPPSEKYNDDTVNAAFQNGLQYFVGGQSFMRFAPAWVAGGRFLFFPRTVDDDIAFSRAALMDEPEELLAEVTRQCDYVGRLSGLYALGLHSQTFEESSRQATLAQILKALAARNYWKATFGEITEWWRSRLEIDAELVSDEDTHAYRLVVTNRGEKAVNDLAIELDARGIELHVVDRPLASVPAGTILEKSTDGTLVKVASIEAKQALIIDLASSDSANAPVAEKR